MNKDMKSEAGQPAVKSRFSDSLLAALFASIGAAGLGLIYIFICKKTTDFAYSEIINPQSIIFFTIIVMLICGLFYQFLNGLKGGGLIYVIVVLALMVVGAFIKIGQYTQDGTPIPSSARVLQIGLDLIFGLTAAFVLPYLVKHPHIWRNERVPRQY